MKKTTFTVALFGVLIFSSVIPVGASSMWSQTYGGAYSDSIGAMVQTGDGGYALAGYTFSFSADHSNEFWLVKVDSSGNMQWNQTYGGQTFDDVWAIVEATDGGYALAGITGSFGAGEGDGWLIKTDEYGVVPEFPSWIILPLFLIATLFAVTIKRVRGQR